MGTAVCTSDVCNVVSRVIVAVDSKVVVNVRRGGAEELCAEELGRTEELLLLLVELTTTLEETVLLLLDDVEAIAAVVDSMLFVYLRVFEILLFVDDVVVVCVLAAEIATAADVAEVV